MGMFTRRCPLTETAVNRDQTAIATTLMTLVILLR
jgi:hypothetical protein